MALSFNYQCNTYILLHKLKYKTRNYETLEEKLENFRIC